MKPYTLFSLLISASLLAGCNFNCSVSGSSGRTIKARGVSYSVPWETSDHSDTPAGFSYKGESVTVSEVGGQLTVDGKQYGAVKSGDTVSLVAKGRVLVNGAVRQPK